MRIIAGPCMLESEEMVMKTAEELVAICDRLGVELCFKGSFDKANRTSIHSQRGPGMEMGLKWLAEVKGKYGVKVVTDIHEPYQAAPVAEVCDIIQIPAFL